MPSTIETSSEVDHAAHASVVRCPGGERFLPSPEEIAAACQQIQSEWSPEQERGRRVFGAQREEWAVPRVIVGQ